jgi:hypothetical protein
MASVAATAPGKPDDAGKSWVAEHLQWMRAKKASAWRSGHGSLQPANATNMGVQPAAARLHSRACVRLNLQIWPEGYRVRYLWTDGLGVVLLLSMWHATGEARYLDEAKAVTEDVYAKLGDARCMRIGLEPRDDR